MMIRLFLAIFIAALGAIQQAPSQSTKTPAPAPGAITGLILDDDGKPVAGAQVIVDRVDSRNLMQFIDTDDSGRFKTSGLPPGLYAMEVHYRLNVDLPGADWYVRSIIQPAGASNKKIEVSRGGVTIKSGAKITGVEVIISDGGASLSGRVVPAHEAQSKNGVGVSPRLQIHLLPAEESAKDDLLRYAETLAAKNGSFEFKNIAPGKYWALARPAPETESVEIQSRPVAWDEGERIKLRRDTKKGEIELKPCQRLDDYALKAPLR